MTFFCLNSLVLDYSRLVKNVRVSTIKVDIIQYFFLIGWTLSIKIRVSSKSVSRTKVLFNTPDLFENFVKIHLTFFTLFNEIIQTTRVMHK